MHHLTAICQATPFQTQSCLISKISQFFIWLIVYFSWSLITWQIKIADVTWLHFSIVLVRCRMHAGRWFCPIMEAILEIVRKDAGNTSRETDRIKSVVDLYKHSRRERGTLLYKPYRYVLPHRVGLVFAPFGSENGCRLCPFWSGIGYSFRRNYGSV